MTRQLSTLLLGLLLVVAAACSKKKDPEPEASLDGTWHQTYQHFINYNADGSVRQDYGRVPASPVFAFEFVGTTLKQAMFDRSPTGEIQLVPTVNGTYTRTANMLTIQYTSNPIEQYQITKLNTTTLILESTRPNTSISNTGSFKAISEFQRQ